MAKRILQTSKARAGREGFIIVTVLWILGALSVLVSIYAVYARNTALGFTEYDNRLRAEALFSAALELTAYRQLTIPMQSRPTKGAFSFRLGQANVAVTFCSESARIDLNKAPKQLLAGLFRALGVRTQDAETYSERIATWRAPSLDRAASDIQQQSAALPRQMTKFPHVNELALVDALPIALVERALPFVTVYSGTPRVNFNDAAAEIIAALPGMTPDRVNAFLAQRKAHPEKTQELLQLLGPAQQYASNEGSRTLRVQTRISFDNAGRASSEAVIILFDRGDEPYSVLSWRSQLDGSLSDPERRTRT